MIFCRFTPIDDAGSDPKFGIIENHKVKEISPDPFNEFEIAPEESHLNEIQLHAPTVPSKIVAVGLNYKAHAKEMNEPLPSEPILFLKPATSIIGPQSTIAYPSMSGRVDFEAELAVIIKKPAKNISKEQADEFILGYSCFNDVTARDLQKKDGQWTRAKSFDTFSPIGPWIVTGLNSADSQIESYLNGELKQSSNTRDLIFDVQTLVSFISQVMTLHPGDVVITGTPPGIGPMQKGDMIDIRIEGIGVLRNFVN